MSDTPTLSEARQALADVLSDLPGVGTATPRPTTKTPRYGDAWVVMRELAPARFGGVCSVQLIGVVCLGADKAKAEEHIDALAVPLLNAVTEALPAAGVKVEPGELPLSDSATGSVFVITIVLTTEVS